MGRHYIRPNHNEAGPSCHVFLDVESRKAPWPDHCGGEIQSLRLWRACSVQVAADRVLRERWGGGTRIDEFWNWLKGCVSRERRTWIWGHHLFVDCTWLGLWDALQKGIMRYHWGAFERGCWICQCGFGKGSVTWVDSYNWFGMSLEALGVLLGVHKGKTPADGEPDAVWADYCEQDVLVLRAAILALIRVVRGNDMGQLRPTPASQAWHSWRHQHQGPWPEVHGNPIFSKFERAGAFGGRSQLGFVGSICRGEPEGAAQRALIAAGGALLTGTGVHVFDATGFYPWIMHQEHMPRRVVEVGRGLGLMQLEQACRDFIVTARVRIKTEKEVFPCRRKWKWHSKHTPTGSEVHWQSEDDPGTPFFVRGHYWTILTGRELTYALYHNLVAECSDYMFYERAVLFREWVEKTWRLREQYRADGDKLWTDVLKKIMNALPGKMAQHAGGWIDTKRLPFRQDWGGYIDTDPDTLAPIQCRAIAGNVQEFKPGGEHEDAVVSIYNAITAAGRAFVSEWGELLPERDRFYADTDAWHVSDNGKRLLELRDVLGNQGLGAGRIKEQASMAVYRNLRTYYFGDETRIAGLPSQRTEDGPFRHSFIEWERFAQRLERGPDATIRLKRTKIQHLEQYRGGMVAADGFVTPFWIDDVGYAGEVPF